jgi:hypothetical protein
MLFKEIGLMIVSGQGCCFESGRHRDLRSVQDQDVRACAPALRIRFFLAPVVFFTGQSFSLLSLACMYESLCAVRSDNLTYYSYVAFKVRRHFYLTVYLV